LATNDAGAAVLDADAGQEALPANKLASGCGAYSNFFDTLILFLLNFLECLAPN